MYGLFDNKEDLLDILGKEIVIMVSKQASYG